MNMAYWGASPRGTYTPLIPSPLNPSNSGASKQYIRRDYSLPVTRREKSPTQILLRQKAAVAWRSMSSGDAGFIGRTQRVREGVDTKATWQKEGPYPARATPVYHSAVGSAEYRDFEPGMQKIDMEKQALVNGDYRGDWLPETIHISHSLGTRRLILMIGFLCLAGVLLAMRMVGRAHSWRT